MNIKYLFIFLFIYYYLCKFDNDLFYIKYFEYTFYFFKNKKTNEIIYFFKNGNENSYNKCFDYSKLNLVGFKLELINKDLEENEEDEEDKEFKTNYINENIDNNKGNVIFGNTDKKRLLIFNKKKIISNSNTSKNSKNSNLINDYLNTYLEEYEGNEIKLKDLYEHYNLNSKVILGKLTFKKEILKSSLLEKKIRYDRKYLYIKDYIIKKLYDEEDFIKIKEFCNSFLEKKTKKDNTDINLIFELFKNEYDKYISFKYFKKLMLDYEFKQFQYNGQCFYKIVIRNLEEEKKLSNQIKRFIKENLIFTSMRNYIKPKDLYNHYINRGFIYCSKVKFNKELKKLGYHYIIIRGYKYLKGYIFRKIY